MAWRSFVALGDSFTEGIDDTYPDGTLRGWADLVAARLAEDCGSDFGYANLAVRGRLLEQVIEQQVPPALAMQPDLISFAAGGNDALRPRVDTAALVRRLDTVVAQLRATGADVILFRYADVTGQLPARRIVGPRAAVLNDGARALAERHGAYVIDLFGDDTFRHPYLWSGDRLHLSSAGHRRVAGQVLSVLGVGADDDWMQVPPNFKPLGWLGARGADLRWAHQHLMPWFSQRVRGHAKRRAYMPKRPMLTPIDR